MKTENRIQQEVVIDYKNRYCLKGMENRCMILHIPNEGKPQLVQIGLYPGAADLLIIHYGMTIFAECKQDTGIQSPAQKKFEAHCIEIGKPYFIFRSKDEFYDKLLRYETTK